MTSQPYTNDARCARCQARDRRLAHDVCLECIASVYVADGNWCAEHGVYPLQWETVAIADWASYQRPRSRDAQRCPWCCHECRVPLVADSCAVCEAMVVAGEAWAREVAP